MPVSTSPWTFVHVLEQPRTREEEGVRSEGEKKDRKSTGESRIVVLPFHHPSEGQRWPVCLFAVLRFSTTTSFGSGVYLK